MSHKRTEPQLPKTYLRYIENLCDYFRKAILADEYRLGLAHYDIIPGEDSDTLATVRVNDVYLKAYIQIAGGVYEYYQQKHYFEVANTIAHELCHIVTHPLKELIMQRDGTLIEEARQTWERQTQRVTNIVMKYTPKSVYMPKGQ